MRGECKKGIVLAIIIMFFITNFSSAQARHLLYENGDQEVSKSIYNEKTTRSDKKWTFMAYLDGDYNDLQSDVFAIINDMELVGSTSDVNIIVQADDYNGWSGQTRRYYVEHDDNPAEHDRNPENITSPLANIDTSEKNMGDPQTLIDFVCWTIDNYPAEHYSLTLFDHGLGWKGICFDQTSNFESIDTNELKYAMTMISNYSGRNLDILILDACMMGMMEVLYPIREYVSIAISSEDRTAFGDISYKGILENLTDQPLVTPSQFAQKTVDTSYYAINDLHTHEYFGINMDKIEEITEVVNELVQVLKDNMPPNFMIKEAYSYSLCWEGGTNSAHPHDIRRFAEKISDLVYNTDIKNKANELMNTIDASVIRPQEGNNSYIDPRLNGIAIYFPPKKSDFEAAYTQLEFANNSQWDEFLSGYYTQAIKSAQQTILVKILALKNLRIDKIIGDFRSLILSIINYITQKQQQNIVVKT